MLEQNFAKVYTKFKLHFYTKIFSRFQEREATLSAVETFSVEAIFALDRPTVREFAEFAQISAPNAAYKINSLVKKGYIRRVQSQADKREFHLVVTDKFFAYHDITTRYIATIMERMQQRFPPEELAVLDRLLGVMADELMPEVTFPLGERE